MGCTPTRCKNCNKPIKSCQKATAKDGKSCCKGCVTAYNEKIK